MNFVTWIMAAFAVLGALDRILGNRFGIGREFERGLETFGSLALSMIGMIVLAPVIADLLRPALSAMAQALPIDPSIVPASLFAIDMGGAPLSEQLSANARVGAFNGLVVASMMGCTVSFTVPYALGAVKKEQHRALLVGLLCGIVTIPVGCLLAGFLAGIPIVSLLLDLCPLAVFSGVIALGLWKAPDLCVKIFSVVGLLIKILITVGLIIGIVSFLTGFEILPGADSFENAAMIVVNAAVVLTGAFPLIKILSRVLARPLGAMGRKIGVNDTSMMGFLSSLAASMTTFENMKDMDDKGVVFNSAFSVSAAFALTDHLAYTLAWRADYLPAVTVGKLSAGVLAVLVALVVYRRLYEKNDKIGQ